MTCWVRAEPNTRRTLQQPSREEHDRDDDDRNDEADECGILPGLRNARGRPWQELAPGNTTERIGTFQVSGGRARGGLTLLLKSSNRGYAVRWFLLGTT